MVRFVDETESDFRRLIEADLGRIAPNTSFDQALLNWLSYRARSVPQQPRRVVISREVDAVQGKYSAIGKIDHELRSGGDLRPWLSDGIRKRRSDPKADLMFNDWQISHFHLGRIFVQPTKIRRTSDLLFAYIRSSHAVLLDVQPHGAWTMTSLLAILLRESPSDMPELKGVLPGKNFTEEEHLRLRMAGVNVPIAIDGRVFVGPGLGLATSGAPTRLVGRLQRALLELRERLAQSDITPDLIRQLTDNLAVPVQLGVRIQGSHVIAYDKARRLDLMLLQSLE